jgi:xanthine permease XanP
MFGTVGAAGIRIIASSEIGRRDMLIMAVAFGLGFGVAYVPEFLSKAPKAIQQIFGSAVTTGGITALLLNAFLPRPKDKLQPFRGSEVQDSPEISTKETQNGEL